MRMKYFLVMDTCLRFSLFYLVLFIFLVQLRKGVQNPVNVSLRLSSRVFIADNYTKRSFFTYISLHGLIFVYV